MPHDLVDSGVGSAYKIRQIQRIRFRGEGSAWKVAMRGFGAAPGEDPYPKFFEFCS